MNRLREIRQKLNMTAKDLANTLQIPLSTLYSWENGQVTIPTRRLDELAKILNCNVQNILGLPNEQHQLHITKPLPINALSIQHGAPVWSSSTGWVLVNAEQRILIDAYGHTTSFDKIEEPLFLIPPFQIPLSGKGAPLKPLEIQYENEIWVEPLYQDMKLRSAFRGWYTVYEAYVKNARGDIFSFDGLGQKWLAFKDNYFEKETR